MQLTLVSTQPKREPIVAAGDDLVVALDAAYDLLAASAADDGGLRPQEQFQVWQGPDQAGTRLGTLTILADPADREPIVAAGDDVGTQPQFEYRAVDAAGG